MHFSPLNLMFNMGLPIWAPQPYRSVIHALSYSGLMYTYPLYSEKNKRKIDITNIRGAKGCLDVLCLNYKADFCKESTVWCWYSSNQPIKKISVNVYRWKTVMTHPYPVCRPISQPFTTFTRTILLPAQVHRPLQTKPRVPVSLPDQSTATSATLHELSY